jgi:hypothetical protein
MSAADRFAQRRPHGLALRSNLVASAFRRKKVGVCHFF